MCFKKTQCLQASRISTKILRILALHAAINRGLGMRGDASFIGVFLMYTEGVSIARKTPYPLQSIFAIQLALKSESRPPDPTTKDQIWLNDELGSVGKRV